MKRLITNKLTSSLFVLVVMFPCLSLSAQEHRIALVIGNSAYKSSPLANPVNDANDVAEALTKCNFTVMKSIDADRKEMRRMIRKFGKEINKGAVGLFYYAGHGIQVDGQNYLVPIGAEVFNEDEVKDECLMVSSVLRKMETAGNRLNIIILDACRDNPFGRSFRSSNMGLAKMDAPTGSILAYATAPGSVAADGAGRNGLYTSKLLLHMNTPGLKIEDVFKRVRIDVVSESGNRQTPWESSSLMGDFYFNANRGISIAERPVDSDWKAESKRLELERLELERLKVEMERKKLEDERKQIAAEKEKSIYSSITPEVSEQKVIARDSHFIKYENGVVKDISTGLEWYAGPDRHTSWYEAKAWVESLNVAGGGWRMPTKEELKTLYQKGAGTRNMTPLLKTSGWAVWGEPHGSLAKSAWFFTFKVGTESYHGREYSAPSGRGFAVRSRNMRSATQINKLRSDEMPKRASIDPGVSTTKKVEPDSRYIAHDNGTVLDTQTGLMWASKDNGVRVSWKEAKQYCEDYRGGGYTDWRMPTIDELVSLYDKNKSYQSRQIPYDVHLTELIQLTMCCPWSSSTRGSRAAYFYFTSGGYMWGKRSGGDPFLALPVRNAN